MDLFEELTSSPPKYLNSPLFSIDATFYLDILILNTYNLQLSISSKNAFYDNTLSLIFFLSIMKCFNCYSSNSLFVID